MSVRMQETDLSEGAYDSDGKEQTDIARPVEFARKFGSALAERGPLLGRKALEYRVVPKGTWMCPALLLETLDEITIMAQRAKPTP